MVKRRVAARLFLSIISGLGMQDSLRLMQCGLHGINHAYWYDATTMDANPIIRKGILWLLEFISSFNRRYVFGSKHILAIGRFSQSIPQWTNKLHWRTWFQEQAIESGDQADPSSREDRNWPSKTGTKACPYLVNSDMEMFHAEPASKLHGGGLTDTCKA